MSSNLMYIKIIKKLWADLKKLFINRKGLFPGSINYNFQEDGVVASHKTFRGLKKIVLILRSIIKIIIFHLLKY